MGRWNFSFLVAVVSLMLAGCSPDFVTENIDGLASSEFTSSLNCDSQLAQKVDLSQVEIVGRRVASKGEASSYQLSQSSECSPNQDVIWKSSSGGTSDGGVFEPTFSKTGTYLVTAEVSDSDTGELKLVTYETTVIDDQAAIVAPSVAVLGQPVTFALAIPEGQTTQWVSWNFGQGPELYNNTDSKEYSFHQLGDYTIEVVLDALGESPEMLIHQITIVESLPGTECISELSIIGPNEVVAGEALELSVHVPECLVDDVSGLRWDFGDGSALQTEQSVSHIYDEEGNYTLRVDVYLPHSSEPYVTLTRQITVAEADGGEVITPPPGDDENLHTCSSLGMGKEFYSELYTALEACGTNGTRVDSYRDEVYEECKLVGESRQWVEISRDPRLVSQGECEGQDCVLSDGSLIADGESRLHFLTDTPAGSCALVSEVRLCVNGELQGSVDYEYLSCQDGAGPGDGDNGEGPGDGDNGEGPGDGDNGEGPGDGDNGEGPGDGDNGEGPGDGDNGEGPGDGDNGVGPGDGDNGVGPGDGDNGEGPGDGGDYDGAPDQGGMAQIAQCMKFLRDVEALEPARLTPGHTVIRNNRGVLRLGFYEEFSLINQRGAVMGAAGPGGVGYAEHLHLLQDQRGAMKISVGSATKIDDQRGALCVGVRDGIDQIQNTKGALIIIGTGDEPAVINSLKHHRGAIFLFNADVLNIEDNRGAIFKAR